MNGSFMGSAQRLAIYPGSFDPVTNGHVDILRRALPLFDRVIVALAVNVRKRPLFTVEERREQILRAVAHDPRVEVDGFSGLLVKYAQQRGAGFVLRGLRGPSDFEFELQMAQMNHHLDASVETVFLMSAKEHYFVSSSLVKEVALFGGDIAGLVPSGIAEALSARLRDTSDS
jgi:pantetheine-phosphate adenylyltransferase